jgi:hypothetical protein
MELFVQRRAELLSLGRPLAYQGTVDAIFTLALEQLRTVNPAAGRLLELCALLAPDEIPVPLLLSQPKLLPEPLATAVADPLRQGAVTGVYRQGLLTRDTGDTARMHRLVQTRHPRPPHRGRPPPRTVEAVELLAGLFLYTGESPRSGRDVRSCLPTARPRSTTWGRGLDMRLAVELHEQALAMWQQLHGGDHQSVADSLTLLAIDLRVLREYGRARKLDEQALAMNQRLANSR